MSPAPGSWTLRRMVPADVAAVHALESGVGAAHILDGRQPHSLLLELFTDEGVGTMVVPGAVVPS